MPRIAVINKEKCTPVKCSSECSKFCPVNRTGKQCVVIQEKSMIDEKLCIGCGICQERCPFQAISIINLPEELKDTPMHQYGKNGFRLYRIPIPKFNQITGIIGKNGIGKTTALNILSGKLIPNLGNLEEQSYDTIINHFKGSELQNYFKKLKNKEIKVSYKPQMIDKIPLYAKGKVIDLLKKVDEKNQLKEIAEKLDLTNILDHDISTISGGELQRVAIAATVLKDADLYIFDEPSSYLDIKQRLKISQFIRSLLNEKTAVLLVEHDLIILDYLTDQIHLMYGKETCYGVVSQPKTTKSGINTYLLGFLKEENVRFRDKKIEFLKKQSIKQAKNIPLTSWTEISKKLDPFTLETESGMINKGEIIGILGENSIGKTTFMKILSKELKSDKGNIEKKVKISYKPQYLQLTSDSSVIEAIKEVCKDLNSQKYKMLVLEPLKIPDLYNKKINELSGGELQRVAIAIALLREADLILLDEPSAYLDVEQRLITSKIIKDFIEQQEISALIVDHDLLFLDYFSDKLILFQGIPTKQGLASQPLTIEEGMNKLLEKLKITMRRDLETNRPRINKLDSQLDKKQKQEKRYYY